MANIEQLHDPLDPIAFFKYDWLFEKYWTKSQNSKLYTTYGKLLIQGKRQPNKRMLNNFEQSRLSIKEMRLIFKWKTIKKFAFLTDICFMYQLLNDRLKWQFSVFCTILIDRKHYHKSMANIENLHDPLDPIAFFKYDWLFKNHWTKSQNWKLYTKYGKFYWFMANVSLTNACLTTLSSLDLKVLKKWE